MLAIKKVTLAAAFVAAPIALWGCSSKDDTPQTGGGDGDGTDDNGAAPDALAAEKAIRGVIGDGLYGTDDKNRDKDVITKSYNAVIAAVIKDVGEGPATDALKKWKVGDDVPAVVEKYAGELFAGTLPLTDTWTQKCRDDVANLMKKLTNGTAGCPCITPNNGLLDDYKNAAGNGYDYPYNNGTIPIKGLNFGFEGCKDYDAKGNPTWCAEDPTKGICPKKWCWVDGNKCDLNPSSSKTVKGLSYSYETCGDSNPFKQVDQEPHQ